MDEITFNINGDRYKVSCEISSDFTLVDFIRNHAELRGTKYNCREGACGACIVSVVKNPGGKLEAVNSCLVSITSCHNWDITTIEEVGNRLKGYSPIQTQLAEHNGTQCGYCTPGWVMSMYSLTKSKENLTMLDIEKSLGSNICRCTGYRPILEAFKTFAKDSPNNKLSDIEDLSICKSSGQTRYCLKKNSCSEDGWCIIDKNEVEISKVIAIDLCDGKKWYKVNTIKEIFAILFKEGDDSYMLVAGNTAKGAYPIEEYPRILIDVTGVPELKEDIVDQNLVIGAGTTLTELMEIFQRRSKEEYFDYLLKLREHIELIAHIPVRNLGTIAGNLMIKHQHNEFASDVYLLFETVGAMLTIVGSSGKKEIVNMRQFLQLNMRSRVILNFLLPPLSTGYKLVTLKIMPRSQSVHSIVNAGFLFKLNNEYKVMDARIVYGALSPSFNRALATEKHLLGKILFRNETLQSAIKKLADELVVVELPPNAPAAARKQLAINLFYKGLLILCPKNLLDAKYQSGAQKIHETRSVSEGHQVFDTNKSLWPLNQPISKVDALVQCSGEAAYVEDIRTFKGEVYAAFALSTVGGGKIVSIDPSKALKQRGVIAFYSAKDIPGLNSFTPAGTPFYSTNEEILCSDEIKYYSQPIGIIVAETRPIAERAAKMVTAVYTNTKKPVIDIKDAKKDSSRNTLLASSDAKDKGTDVAKVIKGDHTIYTQYHLSMETLVCVSVPKEDGLDVYASTQYMDALQITTANALNMDQNSIDIHVQRLGGAYGLKISRASQVSIACSLVAKKLNRTCRFIQSLSTNLKAVGKRFPCSIDFEVGVNSSGLIQYNNYTLYEDNGYLINEPLASFGTDLFYNCYENTRWNYKSYNTLTDTAKNTFCRSPGTMENIVMAECFMERIAYEMGLDPLEVRLANLDENKFGDIKEMVENLKTNADYTSRKAEVDKFNEENRWKKRGLRFSLSRWSPAGSQYFDVLLSVYWGDGSVVITHGGIEMGQGINTKAAQVCAYMLNIPLDKIKVKGTNTIVAPNSFATGGSLTSLNAALGTQRACKNLLDRLKPTRQQMGSPTWLELVQKAFQDGVDLQSRGFINADDAQKYNIYGVALAEVEIDVLTGESEIRRVDLTQDVGQSISPRIDIGQIEGAFIMGMGYWTFENLVYDAKGEVLTDRLWYYYVPQARDIPQDFRVYLRKNSYNKLTIFGAKAVGEPPICLSSVISFALRQAVAAARLKVDIPVTSYFQLDGPWTVEKILMAVATKPDQFVFKPVT